MQKSSWIMLGICGVLLCCLSFAYVLSRVGSGTLTRDEATAMVHRMQDAVKHKDVGAIMDAIAPAPETRIANMTPDQTRLMLARAFRSMQNPAADITEITFEGGDKDATLGFNLKVYQSVQDMKASDYQGHITLHLGRVEVSHLLGLYHTTEWRITSATSTGPDPSNWGE